MFIRSGPKSHGPGAHDYPRFLKEWVPLLNERGAKATGAEAFPTKAQLEATDVLILHAQEAGNIPDPADRQNLQAFLARGGGLVVIHAGSVSQDPDWFKSIIGGSWRNGTTKWLEGPMHLYFTDREQPDHPGRLQLGDGRRDLLRHGHPAGGAGPGRRRTRRSPPGRATRPCRSAPTS